MDCRITRVHHSALALSDPLRRRPCGLGDPRSPLAGTLDGTMRTVSYRDTSTSTLRVTQAAAQRVTLDPWMSPCRHQRALRSHDPASHSPPTVPQDPTTHARPPMRPDRQHQMRQPLPLPIRQPHHRHTAVTTASPPALAPTGSSAVVHLAHLSHLRSPLAALAPRRVTPR